jgi:hypothetical protein
MRERSKVDEGRKSSWSIVANPMFSIRESACTLDDEFKDRTDVKRFFDPCIPLLPFMISSQISMVGTTHGANTPGGG